MEIEWVILSRQFTRQTDASFDLLGVPGDVRVPPVLPWDEVVPVVFKVATAAHEHGQPYTVEILIRRPDGSVASDPVVLHGVAATHPSAPAGWSGYSVAGAGVAFQITSSGPHDVEVRLNGGDPYVVPFLVVLAEP